MIIMSNGQFKEKLQEALYRREMEYVYQRRFDELDEQIRDLREEIFNLRMKVEGPVPVTTTNNPEETTQ